MRARDAWSAVEAASSFPQYDVGFGGRRAFCRQSYADLGELIVFYISFYSQNTTSLTTVWRLQQSQLHISAHTITYLHSHTHIQLILIHTTYTHTRNSHSSTQFTLTHVAHTLTQSSSILTTHTHTHNFYSYTQPTLSHATHIHTQLTVIHATHTHTHNSQSHSHNQRHVASPTDGMTRRIRCSTSKSCDADPFRRFAPIP